MKALSMKKLKNLGPECRHGYEIRIDANMKSSTKKKM
jgi:hypothetical protein